MNEGHAFRPCHWCDTQTPDSTDGDRTLHFCCPQCEADYRDFQRDVELAERERAEKANKS